MFGVKDGVRGFYTNPSRADDCFVPFKRNITYKTVTIGSYNKVGVGTNKSSQTFDVSSYPGYKNFTVYNFFYSISIYCHQGGSNDGKSHGISLSYNNTTGVLTISRSGTSGSYEASGTIYLTYAELQ